MIHFKVLSIQPNLNQLEAIWNALESYSHSYFTSWGWIESYLKTFQDGRKFFVLLGYENDELVSTCIFSEYKNKVHRILPYTFLFLNTAGDPDGLSPYIEFNDILVKPGIGLSFYEELFSFLIHDLKRCWDLIEVPYTKVDSLLFEYIKNTKLFHDIFFKRKSPAYFVDLSIFRNSEQEYLSSFSKKTRVNIRQNLRRYDEVGPLRLDVADNRKQAVDFLDELIHYHQSYWRQKGCPGAFGNLNFLQFHKLLIDNRFEKDEIQLIKVSAALRTVGVIYNFVFKGVIYFYQSGFNYGIDNRLSPGMVTLYKAIEYNALKGHSVFSFLAGEDDYKRRLATSSEDLVWLQLRKKNLKNLSIGIWERAKNAINSEDHIRNKLTVN